VDKSIFVLGKYIDYYRCIEIGSFANMLKDPSSCYKFYVLVIMLN